MTHYGYIGYRSLGTPELEGDQPEETQRCPECGEQVAASVMEYVKDNYDEECCEDCFFAHITLPALKQRRTILKRQLRDLDGIIGYNNGGTL